MKRSFKYFVTVVFLTVNFLYASNYDVFMAYKNRQSDVQVEGSGKVVKILKDDLKGSHHQRFILKLDTGITVLIAHNIDLAKRVKNLRVGDVVHFYGEYEYNKKGGVIHWTHDDPRGKHPNGWLMHRRLVYH